MPIIPLNYYTISLLIGGFTALSSGLVVIIHNYRKTENVVWFLLTVSTTVWSLGYLTLIVSPNYEVAVFSNQIVHYAAILIPLFYYLLILIITNTYLKNRIIFWFFATCSLFFLTVSTSSSFISDLVPKVNFNYTPEAGPLYIFFFLYFVFVVLAGITTTAIAAYNSKDRSNRLGFIYTIIFTVSASVGGGSTFITTYYSQAPPFLLILFSIYPAISIYAIARHHLFNIRVIMVQIITFALWTLILIRTVLSDDFEDFAIQAGLLAVSIVFGIFLIRGVLREIRQREWIESLADELKEAYDDLKELNDGLERKVAEQTKEIRQAYEVEKKARSELEKLNETKDHFITSTQHYLRTPLTSLKWELETIRGGAQGGVGPELKKALEGAGAAVKELERVVENFIQITDTENENPDSREKTA